MKKTYAVFSVFAALALGGCATHVREIDLTGNILVDGPRAIAEGPPRDKVLWQYRTAAGDMRVGDNAQAKQMLDDALLTLGGIYGKDKNAAKSRGYFTAENKKTFIGEPYERVMAYYYRGILYWMDGEPDNARACFRTGQLEDSSSEGEQFTSDYVLLDYLDGLATTKLGDDGSAAFQRAEKLCTQFPKPPAYDPAANVLVFIEFGPGPRKYGSGEYKEELRIRVPECHVASATVRTDGQAIGVRPYDDLGFQATTRGGRLMDHILGNKAVFKSATDIAGDVGIIGGAAAALSRNRTSEEVGLGLIAAGVVSKIISASTTPAADTRAWDNLPRYLTFAALPLPPGPHTLTVEFTDEYNRPMPNLTKTINLNVPAEKRDKVVFVSDASLTPQNL